MTQYIVHLYREMRLTFADIVADTPEGAAAIARAKTTDQADNIEDCNGENISALVDLAGDEDYSQSVSLDFDAERIRKAAPALLVALEGIIDYAENEAYSLEKLKDSPEAVAEAERAWKAVEMAQSVIAQAKTVEMSTAPGDNPIRAWLAEPREIASLWSIEDVQDIRPDLNDQQAWQVLEAAERHHDATIGINWDVLRYHADTLFGDAPETDETAEA